MKKLWTVQIALLALVTFLGSPLRGAERPPAPPIEGFERAQEERREQQEIERRQRAEERQRQEEQQRMREAIGEQRADEGAGIVNWLREAALEEARQMQDLTSSDFGLKKREGEEEEWEKSLVLAEEEEEEEETHEEHKERIKALRKRYQGEDPEKNPHLSDKGLKDILDAGIITKEDYDKIKKITVPKLTKEELKQREEKIRAEKREEYAVLRRGIAERQKLMAIEEEEEEPKKKATKITGMGKDRFVEMQRQFGELFRPRQEPPPPVVQPEVYPVAHPFVAPIPERRISPPIPSRRGRPVPHPRARKVEDPPRRSEISELIQDDIYVFLKKRGVWEAYVQQENPEYLLKMRRAAKQLIAQEKEKKIEYRYPKKNDGRRRREI